MLPIYNVLTQRGNSTSNKYLVSITGWIRCDGTTIPEPSIWQGLLSPNLNSDGFFLRGGSDAEVLDTQEDQIQDHGHTDYGHTHGSDSHYHQYTAYYSELYGGGGTGECKPDAGQCIHYEYGNSRLSNIIPWNQYSASASIGIHSSTSGIGGVEDGYRKGSETRPINMKVVYIMKIF